KNHKNIVFFHGFLGSPGFWIGNPEIDLYCGNSHYSQRTIETLLSLPDAHFRSCLDPRAFDIVTSLTLPLPFLEEPEGYDGVGGNLPSHVKKWMESKDILGHGIQPRKGNPISLYMIMFYLNELAKKNGNNKKYRIFISNMDMQRLEQVRNHVPMKMKLE